MAIALVVNLGSQVDATVETPRGAAKFSDDETAKSVKVSANIQES